jgi:hypothetical protein
MSSVYISKGLKHRFQTHALRQLKQGTTLQIKSNLLPLVSKITKTTNEQLSISPLHVKIQPSWRDDGFATLRQVFNHNDNDNKTVPNEISVQMNVFEEQNAAVTTLGRVGSLVRIELTPIYISNNKDLLSLQQSNTTQSSSTTTIPPSTTSLETDRIMLDDGSLHLAKEFVKISSSTVDLTTTEYHDGIAHVADETTTKTTIDPKQSTSTEDAAVEQPGIYLTINVPEKLGLICDLSHNASNNLDSESTNDFQNELCFTSSVEVSGKVEGNVQIHVENGNIDVTKLRGHNIDLHSTQTMKSTTTQPRIYASSLLEAQTLNVTCQNGRVRAKQIHGNTINIDVTVDDNNYNSNNDNELLDNDDEGSIIDVSSIFVSGNGGASLIVSNKKMITSIQQDTSTSTSKQLSRHVEIDRRAVRLKSNHGPIQVKVNGLSQPSSVNIHTDQTYPLVELGGVNGNCEVSIDNTNINSNDNPTGCWTSCMIHLDSLSPESVSLAVVDKGIVSLTVDRKVEADVRLLSTSNGECIVESGSLLAEEENSTLLVDVLRQLANDSDPSNNTTTSKNRISILTKAFTNRNDSSFSQGCIEYIEGWVDNKSNEPDSRFERKMRGSNDTSSGSVGKIRLDSASDQALKTFSTGNDTDTQSSSTTTLRPLFAAVGTSNISIETVSWLGAIARRFGLDENYKNELGRTALRRGRNLPNDE